jgi:hypothetical protein
MIIALLNQIEEMKGELVEILPNTRLKMVHLAIRCASILAHLKIFKTLQTFIESK